MNNLKAAHFFNLSTPSMLLSAGFGISPYLVICSILGVITEFLNGSKGWPVEIIQYLVIWCTNVDMSDT